MLQLNQVRKKLTWFWIRSSLLYCIGHVLARSRSATFTIAKRLPVLMRGQFSICRFTGRWLSFFPYLLEQLAVQLGGVFGVLPFLFDLCDQWVMAPDRERTSHMEQGSVGERPQPVVMCGPSGVGKGTLIAKLMKEYPDKFGFAVSHTTRKPRYMEQDGVHYHFTQRPDMEEAVREGKFLESAEVHGNMYGTSIAAVEAVADEGKRCILDIDVQGAQQVKKTSLDALFIFISPPSFQELEARLRGRGTESEEQIQKRLKNAKAEMERSSDTTLFDHMLVNDDIEETYKQFKKLLGLGTEALENGFH